MRVTNIKENLHKHGRKTAIFSAVCALVVSGFIPMVRARAIDNPNDYVEMRMRGATGITIQDANISASYDGGSVSISGATDPVYEVQENWNFGDHAGDMHTLYTKSSSLTFTAQPNANKQAEAWINGQRVNLIDNTTYTWSDLQKRGEVDGNYFGYEIEFTFIDSGVQPQPEGNQVAHLRVKGGDGSYESKHPGPDGEEVTETKYYKDTYIESRFAINDGFPGNLRPEGEVRDEQGNFLYNQLDYRYDAEDSEGTIKLRVSTLWHLKLVNKIFVNGQEYIVSNYINYDDRNSWLSNYKQQEVGIDLIVPKAADDIYDITVDVEDGGKTYIGNFLWTGDPEQEFMRDPETGEYILDENGNKIRGYDYIGHSRLALVGVSYEYGGETYSCDEEELASDTCVAPVLEYAHDESLEYDDGSLVVPDGARVTMRVIPERGYQVTDINVAELTTTDEGVGEFTFTVPAGAAYFVADVTEVEDKVEADSDTIESGEIVISDDEESLDYGTARLDVKDAELSDNEKAEFEDAAGDYNVSTYLDISLYKTLYKGTEDDTWDDQISELDHEATITLKLKEGVDGNEVVIVHKKHDGTYEVIPTVYDPVAHTITFKTSSFSDYAIAARTVATPDTGALAADKEFGASAAIAIEIALIAVLSTLGIAFIAKRAKK